jgi:hypothetical protein
MSGQEIDYRHFRTLTDKTGIIQFAIKNRPDINSGHTADDNARALLVALNMKGEERLYYTRLFTNFLWSAQWLDGSWSNLKLHQRFVPTLDSEDSLGRTFMACGIGAGCDIDEVAGRCREMYVKALPMVSQLQAPRSQAYAIIGLVRGFDTFVTYQDLLADVVNRLAAALMERYLRQRGPEWRWFEDRLTYCNGIMPQAMFTYYGWNGDKRARQIGEETLGFLSDNLFTRGYLNIVGNEGWWEQGKEIPLFDQQPVDACSIALACTEAFRVTGRQEYRELADLAHSWYEGRNIHGIPLYNQETGGCHDALVPEGLNLNQGAEAVVSLLLARQMQAGMMSRVREDPRSFRAK